MGDGNEKIGIQETPGVPDNLSMEYQIKQSKD